MELPERDTRWLLAGAPEPAPAGWTQLANIARPSYLPFQLPDMTDGIPAPFERFAADLPPDAGVTELVNAALWAILERCPTQAILSGDGVPQVWSGLLAPPPPGRRHTSSNQHITLTLGYVGSGDDGEAGAAERFGEGLVGRPVLLKSKEVANAVRELGLAGGGVQPRLSASAADETRAGKRLQDHLRANPDERTRRADLKQLLAPDLPARAWDRVWHAAAKEFPAIRRPGRLRQKPRT